MATSPQAAGSEISRALFNVVRTIWRRLPSGDRGKIFAVVVLSSFTGLVNSFLPLWFGWLVDSIARSANIAQNATFATNLIAFLFLINFPRIIGPAQSYLYSRFESSFLNQARRVYMQHMLSLPYAMRIDRSIGELDEVFGSAIRGIQSVVGSLANSVSGLFVQLLAALVIISTLGYRYAGLVLASIAAYSVWTYFASRRVVAKHNAFTPKLVRVRALAGDLLLNFEAIRLFGGINYVIDKYHAQLTVLDDAEHQLARSKLVVAVGQSLILVSAATCAILFAVGDIARQDITVGGLVMVNIYLLQLIRPLEGLGGLYREVSRGLAGMGPMANVMLISPEPNLLLGVAEKNGAGEPDSDGQGIDIEFKGVEYRYPESRHAVGPLSFKVPAGSRVGFVGRSGSGKSTIVKLALGLIQPEAGEIRLDGQRLDSHAPRKPSVSVVPQSVLLFDASIAENIRFGRQDASGSEVEQVVRAAGLGVVSKEWPRGLDTTVGELGVRLSGGERQRLGIARALLQRPQLLILDEATSSLDMQTERAIFDEIDRSAVGITTIIVTHRLQNVVGCDAIYYVENGKILESGTHDQLLDGVSDYRAAWSLEQRDGR